MGDRSMIKRGMAFLMTLAIAFPNLFTSEMIHALASNVSGNSLEGTVEWNESWNWKGLAAPGSAFRPSQQGNQAFQLVLNKGREDEMTTQVDLSTESFYIEYTGYETDSRWQYKVTNIPADYVVKSVSVEEVPGYLTGTPAFAKISPNIRFGSVPTHS